jgi:quinol-cytochrome oxidoreductase complex cytochrome b subunit
LPYVDTKKVSTIRGEKMAVNRTTVFLAFLFYLVAVFIVLGLIGNDLAVDYTSTAQGIGAKISFLGLNINIAQGFLGNIVLGIQSLPWQINLLFIGIEAIICGVYGVAQFIPTMPSG